MDELEGLLDDPLSDLEPIDLAGSARPTRFSAEDWKQRALYEEARRRHMERELLRIRDEIDRVVRRAAVLPLDGVEP